MATHPYREEAFEVIYRWMRDAGVTHVDAAVMLKWKESLAAHIADAIARGVRQALEKRATFGERYGSGYDASR